MSVHEPRGLSHWGYVAAGMEAILLSSKVGKKPTLFGNDIYIVEDAKELFERALRGDAFIKNFSNEAFPSDPVESADAFECVIEVMLSLNTETKFLKDQKEITSKLTKFVDFIQNIIEQKPIRQGKTFKAMKLFFNKLSDVAEKEDYLNFNKI